MVESLLALLSILGPASCAPAEAQTPSWDVSGTVVDEAGVPLPAAEIARYFLFSNGTFTAYEGIKADTQGKFAGKIQPYKLPMTYIALDRDRNLGACFVFTEQSVKAPVRVILKPLAEVNFQTTIEDGYVPTSMNTSIGCPDTNTVVLLSYDNGPYYIPEGAYELRFFSIELKTYRKRFSIKSG